MAGREEDRGVLLADHLIGAVAVAAARTLIPGQDGPIERGRDDRVLRRAVEDVAQEGAGLDELLVLAADPLLQLPFLGDVSGRAIEPHYAAELIVPYRSGADFEEAHLACLRHDAEFADIQATGEQRFTAVLGNLF